MEKRKPKVYLLSKSAHNFEPAKYYGELVEIYPYIIYKLNVKMMYRYIQRALEDSTEDDYILLSGHSVFLSTLVSFFASKHKRVNFLIFYNNRYKVRTIVFPEAEKIK